MVMREQDSITAQIRTIINGDRETDSERDEGVSENLIE
jgi:hypothetical protein